MFCRIGGLLLLLFFSSTAWSQITQPCTTLGQLPQTAFPVCGLQTFVQTTVPYCGNHPIPVPGCGPDYGDINPFWYKFTCYKSGTLAFTINPEKQNEDYDWQVFDVTGHDVSEVYSNPALFVVGNWSGSYGPTGTSPTSALNVQCASSPNEHISTFSKEALLIEGHQYLLLVSHFTKEPNGYTLSFTGGTANITDTIEPHLKSAVAKCDGQTITVTLNKKLKCASLAEDGSDFRINANAIASIGARSTKCSSGFDMDTLTVQLNKSLAPGKYTMYMKKGSDGSTLLDYCDNPVPVDDSVSFDVTPAQPSPFDSIIPVGCAPRVIQLYFKKGIRCNSIAADGSDFTVTGPTPVIVTGANGTCSEGLSNVINIHLAKPLTQGGTYRVSIKKGTDGNTVIDECGEETLPSSRSFVTTDTVSALFSASLLYGCKADTIVCANNGGNGILSWNWAFTGGYTAQTQNATVIYKDYGEKTVTLAVSNGVCIDTASRIITLDNNLTAAFNVSSNFICPGDTAIFIDSSLGKINSWQWNFGNGTASNVQSPQLQYPVVDRDRVYTVSLTVGNEHNCFDKAYKTVKVLYTCTIAVPSAFTPNGDNVNDYLYPLNAYKAVGLEFKVFNRFGQVVFSTKDWTNKWDGRFKGVMQPTGSYVWMLKYTHIETHQQYFLKGTSVLIR